MREAPLPLVNRDRRIYQLSFGFHQMAHIERQQMSLLPIDQLQLFQAPVIATPFQTTIARLNHRIVGIARYLPPDPGARSAGGKKGPLEQVKVDVCQQRGVPCLQGRNLASRIAVT